jgi:hypothetical protein
MSDGAAATRGLAASRRCRKLSAFKRRRVRLMGVTKRVVKEYVVPSRTTYAKVSINRTLAVVDNASSWLRSMCMSRLFQNSSCGANVATTSVQRQSEVG